MAAKTKIAKKKRKISKHVLKSREEQDQIQQGDQLNDVSQAGQGADLSEQQQQQPLKKKKGKKNCHVKDPSEAKMYLTEWQNKNQQGRGRERSGWKFNKNTQSWLIRHMYEVEKVPKSTFTILLEYLQGLEGTTTRSWMRQEASRRALRYEEHRRKKDSTTENEDDATADEKVEQQELKKESISSEKSKTPDQLDQIEEEERWKRLDDHDKRKEYKRARKILELIKD